MKLMNALALRHLKRNKKQSLSAFLAITLSVSMLIAVSVFCFSVYGAFVDFEEANGLPDAGGSFHGMMTMGGFLGLIITVAAVIIISNAFGIQASERVKQFGILKSVGATERQIRATVTAESNLLSLAGIPAGVALGHVLCYIAVLVVRHYSEAEAVSGGSTAVITVRFNLAAILLASALGYAAVRFASAMTARKVSKLTAIEAIRQTDELKIDGKNLKTSKIITKVFGFEGTLAAKQLKRHRRKFRVTVLSLVTSVVLTLSAFSFGDTLIKTAMGAYADTGANVVSEVVGNSADFSKFDDYTKMLKSQNPLEMHTLYSYRYIPGEGGPSEGVGEWYNIITMDDADYDAYCRQSGVTPGANILLGQSMVEKQVPFDISLPDLGNANLSVTEKSDVTDPYMKSITMSYEPNIIVPRGEARRLGVPIEAHCFIIAENAAGFIAKIEPAIAAFGFDRVYTHNTEAYTRELQRMYSMLMIFVYCFIGMLALIGATSVLATINSNINLRQSEFATLRAVGMETKQLYKMLNLESIFYGMKSLLYGLPIGLLLSYFAYGLAVHDTFYLNAGRLSPEDLAGFPFEIPYAAVFVCVFGVFAVGFASMYFATSKLRRSNIAETMRELTA